MAGYRVLRGPDWDEGEADGGEGHLGTITELLSDGKVRVLWDKGQESTYRAGADGKFDLRIFDTGQRGIRHPNTKCQECGEKNIYGVLWRCKECTGYDLCSKCYSEDKHDIRHRFLRIDSFKSNGKEVKQRKTSVKMRAMGIFEGSKVTRGKHWLWGDQDGGPGTQGEVQTFENVAPGSTRNLVRVAWPNGVVNSYRLGFQGQVDLTCVEEEIGPFYYRDHLQLQWKAYTSSPPAISGETTLSGTNTSSPFVSTSTTTSASVVTTSSTNTNTNTFASSTLSSSSSGRSSGSASSKGRTMPIGGNEILGREASGTAITDSVIEEDELLLVGDKVIIGVDEERLVKLQQTFGGCTKGMISRIGIEGVVTAVPSLQTPAVSVKYTEKQSYRLNPAVLVKACGKVGRVRAVDSSGHVTVRIGSQEWKFHAACLLPALGAPLDDVKPEERPDRNLLSDLGMFSNLLEEQATTVT
ncbi:E3 ubiquitin-protein ligase mib1-like [Pomacea canaliculata]|uniref:E3 ubiquitin-protein ligase mib1-like n=1 Tax=Pomacea canaliculata TaxID=400727 RepID=UPI000D73EF5F|nr:E3 ubiquitin-protein ligase mib1-like [Pomacea canaliculata]